MAKTKLLLIADDQDTAKMAQKIASEMFFDVQQSNYDISPEAYDAINPDVIVLDLLMADMHAFKVLELLKSKQSKAIILLLSGRQDSYRRLVEHLSLAAKLNIHGNLPKPFRDMELRQQLREIQMAFLAGKRMGPQSAAV